MSKSLIPLLVASVALFAAGCKTTKASRQTARETLTRIAEYKSAQEAQLKDLNARYQAQSSALVDQTQKLMTHDVEQQLDADALQLADKLLEKWETEIEPSRLQQTFQQSARNNYDKLRSLETALDDLNARYNNGYAKVKARMDALAKIEQNLEALQRTKEDEKREAEVKRLLYRAHE